MLQDAMDAAKSALPLLGPLRKELEKEIAVDGETLVEIKAAEVRARQRQDKNLSDIPEPAQFCCPLSHSTMRDPVIAADGHSYEREWIETHFKKSMTSPLTSEVLKSQELVPNIALKQLIRTYEETVQAHLVQVQETAELARTKSRTAHELEMEQLRPAADPNTGANLQQQWVEAQLRISDLQQQLTYARSCISGSEKQLQSVVVARPPPVTSTFARRLMDKLQAVAQVCAAPSYCLE